MCEQKMISGMGRAERSLGDQIVEILGQKLVAHIRFQKFLRNLKAHVCEPM
jgi:hypothetical protein